MKIRAHEFCRKIWDFLEKTRTQVGTIFFFFGQMVGTTEDARKVKIPFSRTQVESQLRNVTKIE